jgi:hypothetical protein
MAADPLRKVHVSPEGEMHNRVVPVTIADAKYTISLPAGWYFLRMTGAQVNAGTDGDIILKKFVDAAQTTADAVALYGEDIATIVGIATAIDMEAADTGMEFWWTGQKQATNENIQPSPIWLPYGLELTVDINNVTVLALTLHAQKLSF